MKKADIFSIVLTIVAIVILSFAFGVIVMAKQQVPDVHQATITALETSLVLDEIELYNNILLHQAMRDIRVDISKSSCVRQLQSIEYLSISNQFCITAAQEQYLADIHSHIPVKQITFSQPVRHTYEMYDHFLLHRLSDSIRFIGTDPVEFYLLGKEQAPDKPKTLRWEIVSENEYASKSLLSDPLLLYTIYLKRDLDFEIAMHPVDAQRFFLFSEYADVVASLQRELTFQVNRKLQDDSFAQIDFESFLPDLQTQLFIDFSFLTEDEYAASLIYIDDTYLLVFESQQVILEYTIPAALRS